MDADAVASEAWGVIARYSELRQVYPEEWVRKQVAGASEVWMCHPIILLALDHETFPHGLRWREAALTGFRKAGRKRGPRQLGHLRGQDIANWWSTWSEARVAAWMAATGVRVVSYDKPGRGDFEAKIDGTLTRLSVKSVVSDWRWALHDGLVRALDIAFHHPESPYAVEANYTYSLRWAGPHPDVPGQGRMARLTEQVVRSVGEHVRAEGFKKCRACDGRLEVTFAPDAATPSPRFSHGPLTLRVAAGPDGRRAGCESDLPELLERKGLEWTDELQGFEGPTALIVDVSMKIGEYLDLVSLWDRIPLEALGSFPTDAPWVGVVAACVFDPGGHPVPRNGVYWASPQVKDGHPGLLRWLTPWRGRE